MVAIEIFEPFQSSDFCSNEVATSDPVLIKPHLSMYISICKPQIQLIRGITFTLMFVKTVYQGCERS